MTFLRNQIESEGITENVKSWRTDVISSITTALPNDKLMFEAAEPAVFSCVPFLYLWSTYVRGHSQLLCAKFWCRRQLVRGPFANCAIGMHQKRHMGYFGLV